MDAVLKRIIVFIVAVVTTATCCGLLSGCGGARDELLRVYVPGEYMDPDVYDEFAEWYAERTGKNIEVRETTFESNESMLLKIEKSKNDYDLVCPSDYMIEQIGRASCRERV